MSPRVLPAGAIEQLKKQGGFYSAVALLDVTTLDGTQYFWSDFAGSFPRVSDGAAQVYQPWIKQAGPLRRSRDGRTDAGDIVVQNLSGNTIDRDVASALKAHEFEGALAILRFWDAAIDAVMDEFHGYLSEQDAGQEEASFRLLQLCDLNQFEVVDDTYSSNCTLRFKSARCGSVSANATCSKRFSDCTAVERFNGCPSPPPGSVLPQPTYYSGDTGSGVGGGSEHSDPRWNSNL